MHIVNQLNDLESIGWFTISRSTQTAILSIVESHEQSDLIYCWTTIKDYRGITSHATSFCCGQCNYLTNDIFATAYEINREKCKINTNYKSLNNTVK